MPIYLLSRLTNLQHENAITSDVGTFSITGTVFVLSLKCLLEYLRILIKSFHATAHPYYDCVSFLHVIRVP